MDRSLLATSARCLVVALLCTGLGTLGGAAAASPSLRDPGTFALPPGALGQVEAVPAKALLSAAALARKSKSTSVNAPQALPAHTPALSSGGKPEVLYIGAEYCPYCAAERWAMVMALSKFGTFSQLRGTTSSSTDIDPSTPTLSFYGSAYKSQYLQFVSVELETNTGATLQNPTAQQAQLLGKWDQPPYVQSSQYDDSIPFIYLAGRYVQIGTQYDASPISGWTFAKAASYLSSGTNKTSRAAEAAAGYLVADICALTHGRPARACSAVPASLKR
jgi:thiol-disulfide isomerase/thioredoxin